MDANRQDTSNKNTPSEKTTQAHHTVRRSARKSSLTQGGDICVEITAATKRKRSPTQENMSKNKKPNNNGGELNPTNAQLMTILDRLADKMDQLPNKSDLRNVESELVNKMHQNAAKFDKKIQDNAREIRAVNDKLGKQAEDLAKLEQELERQKAVGPGAETVAGARRREAREDKFMRARRSFRIWPVPIGRDEVPDVCVRRFFINNMKAPASLVRDVEIEQIKKAIQSHPRTKIHDEYIVIFKEAEARDAIKAYASGLASCQGQAGLRLELTDTLKGSYRVLDQHGIAIKELYGGDTKRNIKFDDRTNDLMMDIKLPNNPKWHNITVEQAKKARKMREDTEIAKLSQGKSIAGPSIDRERAKALMLVYTPENKSPGLTTATGANLIDIENSFVGNGWDARSGPGMGRGGQGVDEGEETCGDETGDGSGNESDESMARLLHGRTGTSR